MHYVYFIQSVGDRSIYVGSTSDLRKRLMDHNAGKTFSTKSKIPYQLIYYEAYLSKTIARKRELQLKRSWNEKKTVTNRLVNKEWAPSSNG